MWDDLETSKQRGSAIEELSDQFCKRPFLQDFVFLRPKRINGKKELTDLLAILEESCLCIQIKASGQGSSRSGQRLTNWAIKKFVKAGQQAAGAIRKVKTSTISTTHAWQGNVIFQAGNLTPICGIALVEYLGQPFTLTSEIKHQTPTGIPIHYFSLNDFLNLVDLLGTLPDTIEYLRQRASIVDDARNIIGKERDLIATYLLDGHLRSGLSCKDIENRWSYAMEVKEESFKRKRKHNIFVDFYNGLINELHQRDPDMLSYFPQELITHVKSITDRTSYLEIAAQLNKLPYIHRREIGKYLFQTAKTVKEDGQGRMSTYRDPSQKWAIAFIVTPNMDRTLRIRRLHLLVASAQIQYECQSVIGIACPSLDSNQGYDYIFVDKVTYNKEEIRKFAPRITKSNVIELRTFPDPADDSFLPTDEDFE